MKVGSVRAGGQQPQRGGERGCGNSGMARGEGENAATRGRVGGRAHLRRGKTDGEGKAYGLEAVRFAMGTEAIQKPSGLLLIRKPSEAVRLAVGTETMRAF
eukprot:366271-Chlamydomonas_euryale.AAC.7